MKKRASAPLDEEILTVEEALAVFDEAILHARAGWLAGRLEPPPQPTSTKSREPAT